jgi:hypothetical protein
VRGVFYYTENTEGDGGHGGDLTPAKNTKNPEIRTGISEPTTDFPHEDTKARSFSPHEVEPIRTVVFSSTDFADWHRLPIHLSQVGFIRKIRENP